MMGYMKESRLSQRQPAEILADLAHISEQTHISQPALIAACIRGLRKTWDQNHELTFPFVVVPESSVTKPKEK
jgi:hypothetical protein